MPGAVNKVFKWTFIFFLKLLPPNALIKLCCCKCELRKKNDQGARNGCEFAIQQQKQVQANFRKIISPFGLYYLYMFEECFSYLRHQDQWLLSLYLCIEKAIQFILSFVPSPSLQYYWSGLRSLVNHIGKE